MNLLKRCCKNLYLFDLMIYVVIIYSYCRYEGIREKNIWLLSYLKRQKMRGFQRAFSCHANASELRLEQNIDKEHRFAKRLTNLAYSFDFDKFSWLDRGFFLFFPKTAMH